MLRSSLHTECVICPLLTPRRVLRVIPRRFARSIPRLFLLCLLLLLLPGCAGTGGFFPGEEHLHRGSFVSAGAMVSATAPDSLTVVSYNIQYGKDIDLALDDLRADPRLRDADIILLQEMDPAGVDTMAQVLGLHYVYYPASVHPHHDRYFGNAVLSRWPIVGQQVLVLPHGNPVNGHRRIAVAADLDVAGRPLRAVSVHLSTMILTPRKRLDQVSAVLDSLTAVDGAMIIGGDFNSETGYDEVHFRRRMRRMGFRRAFIPRESTVRWNPLRLTGLDFVLDHIFYRGLKMWRAGIGREALASDHYPIWAVFGWVGEEDSR